MVSVHRKYWVVDQSLRATPDNTTLKYCKLTRIPTKDWITVSTAPSFALYRQRNVLFSEKSTTQFLKYKQKHTSLPAQPVQTPSFPPSQSDLLLIILHIHSKYLHTPPSSRRPNLFQRLTRLGRRRLQRLAQRDGRRDIKAR